MEGLMKGRKGLVTGIANDHSIAWGIARTLHQHGAEIAVTYQGDAFGRRVKPLAEQIGSKLVMPCDVEDSASVEAVFETLGNEWGEIDFIVHAIALPPLRPRRRRSQAAASVTRLTGHTHEQNSRPPKSR